MIQIYYQVILSKKKIYPNEYLLHENLKRNLDSNKLTQIIRAEVFDRESVNRNVTLTTKEMKKYYEEINKKLDEQLYVNKKKIRIRDNKANCNVSGIKIYSNYNKNLKPIRRDEENESSENSEEIEEKNKINDNQGKNEIKIDSPEKLKNNNANVNTNNDNNENINKIKSNDFDKNLSY